MTTATTLQEHKTFKPGQIVSCSWGYSMTIVDFFVVIRRTEKTVWIQPIGRDVKNDNGMGNGTAMPDMELNATGAVQRFKIQTPGIYDDGAETIWDRSHQRSIRIWNMKPQYVNSYD
jgi:hypothetical protein